MRVVTKYEEASTNQAKPNMLLTSIVAVAYVKGILPSSPVELNCFSTDDTATAAEQAEQFYNKLSFAKILLQIDSDANKWIEVKSYGISKRLTRIREEFDKCQKLVCEMQCHLQEEDLHIVPDRVACGMLPGDELVVYPPGNHDAPCHLRGTVYAGS